MSEQEKVSLKLQMGSDTQIKNQDNSKKELGKISYAFDTHNLYIDGNNNERQQIDARYATGLKYSDGSAYQMNKNTKKDIYSQVDIPLGNQAITFGQDNIASGDRSLAEGEQNFSCGHSSHSEGFKTIAVGRYSHSEGDEAITLGQGSHSEGYKTITYGDFSHAEGIGQESCAFGKITGGKDSLSYTVTEIEGSIKKDDFIVYKCNYLQDGLIKSFTYLLTARITSISTNEKNETVINLNQTLSPYGELSKVSVDFYSIAAMGQYSHTEGKQTTALGEASHTEGHQTKAIGDYSHAGGEGTIANSKNSTAIGEYNKILEDKNILFTIGNGESDASRSNALTVEKSGATTIYGPVYAISSDAEDKKNPKELATKKYVDDQIKKNGGGGGTNPDTPVITEIFKRGENPPEDDDKNLLWIRTGPNFGNGVLYYYLENTTGMTNVYQNHWVPMSAIYT